MIIFRLQSPSLTAWSTFFIASVSESILRSFKKGFASFAVIPIIQTELLWCLFAKGSDTWDLRATLLFPSLVDRMLRTLEATIGNCSSCENWYNCQSQNPIHGYLMSLSYFIVSATNLMFFQLTFHYESTNTSSLWHAILTKFGIKQIGQTQEALHDLKHDSCCF